MSCIFCDSLIGLNTIEHIVNESLVNYHYTLDKGTICKKCNNKFSKFEEKALSKTILGLERARFGIRSKKGKSVGGSTGQISFKGNSDFKQYFLTISGLNEEDIENFDPTTGTFNIKINGFDKSETAATKLVLKIGFEALFKSQRPLFKKYDFLELKNHLVSSQTKEWPLIVTNLDIPKFKSIPKYTDKHELKKNFCSIEYLEIDQSVILVRFRYGGVRMIANLIDRSSDWIKEFYKHDPQLSIYPQKLSNKFKTES